MSYDELWSVTVTFASAIKTAWPNSRIAGPISYGWCGWWWSELDGCATNGTDYHTHANMYLMPWFLQQLERYYQATGMQLIDILDNHYVSHATRQTQQILVDQCVHSGFTHGVIVPNALRCFVAVPKSTGQLIHGE